jgi:hypothetical protein
MTWQQLIEAVVTARRSKEARRWAEGAADLEEDKAPQTLREWKASVAEAFDAGAKWARRPRPEKPMIGL